MYGYKYVFCGRTSYPVCKLVQMKFRILVEAKERQAERPLSPHYLFFSNGARALETTLTLN